MTAILSKEDILGLIRGKPSLIEGYVNLEEQLQPNGIDLTLREVAMLQSAGGIGAGSQRTISDLAPLYFDGRGKIQLIPGAYIITYNEIVTLPAGVMALGYPRSSLLRCGVTLHFAVWDAGYSGRSRSLMLVHNPMGFSLQKSARIMQLIFHRLTRETEGYKGAYQGENI